MKATSDLFWPETPWTGRLAVSSRPRGGDWLEDNIAAWKQAGIDVVVSLLTSAEADELGLLREASCVEAERMKYVALPIPDRDVPPSTAEALRVSRVLAGDLADGFARLTVVRGVAVPETEPQRRWLNEMAPSLRAA